MPPHQSAEEHVNLPEGLRSLVLGTSFNKSLQHVKLPSSLVSLSLGASFNQDLRILGVKRDRPKQPGLDHKHRQAVSPAVDVSKMTLYTANCIMCWIPCVHSKGGRISSITKDFGSWQKF